MKLTRFTSILTAFLLLASPAQTCAVTADDSAAPASGICGESAAPSDHVNAPNIIAEGIIGEKIGWQLDEAGTLTLIGSGDMAGVPARAFSDYNNSIRCVVIQNTDEKKTITAISDALFSGCSGLTSVTLPETITSIGKEAFLNCTALSECNMPASLKEIGKSAFQNTGLTALVLPGCTLGDSAFFCCSSLKTVEIGEGTEIIPGQCFRKCTALESVMLPDSVQEIGCGSYSDQGAFADCPNLKTVSIGKGIKIINKNAFRTTGESLEITFREGVTAIPETAFCNRTELTKVVLPETITSIGKEAFLNCTALSECNMPASLKEIGKSAFQNTGLTALVLPG
ncbi:MAG: leucine-rich repeat domain-containing protein, partial [Oscillospiraceae bacterium]|nr:leucine-rich repeat domain-containing protein [Oscillospiraceae bacterium]